MLVIWQKVKKHVSNLILAVSNLILAVNNYHETFTYAFSFLKAILFTQKFYRSAITGVM